MSLPKEETYKTIIDETRQLLIANHEWRERYAAYGTDILNKIDFIREVKSKFREWAPLRFHINTTNARKTAASVTFDLSYLGQNVATLSYRRGEFNLSTKSEKGDDYNFKNKRDFDCEITLDRSPWDGAEARAFRSHFKNRKPLRNTESERNNDEKRIESMLLTEFSKNKDKALQNIKPVKIGGFRFPMPTPLLASKKGVVKYAKKGGGIDILARTGTGGRNTHLCILEVKDENKPSESADIVIQQALKYTVFIRELLRSEAGAVWWKLFGFNGAIHDTLLLHTICVMPDNDNVDTFFGGDKYDIDGDTIELHYIYFKEAENKIKITCTSLDYGKQVVTLR